MKILLIGLIIRMVFVLLAMTRKKETDDTDTETSFGVRHPAEFEIRGKGYRVEYWT